MLYSPRALQLGDVASDVICCSIQAGLVGLWTLILASKMRQLHHSNAYMTPGWVSWFLRLPDQAQTRIARHWQGMLILTSRSRSPPWSKPIFYVDAEASPWLCQQAFVGKALGSTAQQEKAEVQQNVAEGLHADSPPKPTIKIEEPTGVLDNMEDARNDDSAPLPRTPPGACTEPQAKRKVKRFGRLSKMADNFYPWQPARYRLSIQSSSSGNSRRSSHVQSETKAEVAGAIGLEDMYSFDSATVETLAHVSDLSKVMQRLEPTEDERHNALASIGINNDDDESVRLQQIQWHIARLENVISACQLNIAACRQKPDSNGAEETPSVRPGDAATYGSA